MSNTSNTAIYEVVREAITGSQSGRARQELAETILEAVIDFTTIRSTLEGLSVVCAGKTEHLSTNWQDKQAAKVWRRISNHLDKLSSETEVA